ncbi:MAG: acyl-[acyl-carrier-protein] thioesterase [Bacteroidales bacterium]|nr:acyl-[acyl-carrier-protein] thioesterase [Bacteroidales bacterium]
MEKIFTQQYFLTPAECNPEKRMPITLLINRLIEIATLHADTLGIGYESLVERKGTWVLSRVAVEMHRFPEVNEHYTIRTWVSSINRLFSERDFEILDGDGATIGWARTMWAVLNVETRAVADISHMEWIRDVIPDKQCPVNKPGRLKPLAQYTSMPYTFTYCDLDFNRHVNSSRYIELLLNQWTLDFHDHNRLCRFEIAYIHEAYYDERVEVRLCQDPTAADTTLAELVDGDKALCRALLRFEPRDYTIISHGVR